MEAKFAKVKNYNLSSASCGIGKYLTLNKVYEIIEWDSSTSFIIKDDDGNEALCLINHCAHLGYGTWELIDAI
jgi:hypothetical protein